LPRLPAPAGYFGRGKHADAGKSGKSGDLGGADQVTQRCLGSMSQLTPEEQCDEAAPPPGREVEVSIEPDERAAFFGFGQRHVLVVFEAERKMGEEIDPSLLRVDVDNIDRDRPPAAKPARSEMNRLARVHRAGWIG
jgi:hypothetical protein